MIATEYYRLKPEERVEVEVRHADETRANSSSSRVARKVSPDGKGRLINWQPLDEHKKQLASGIFGPLEALEIMESFAEDGARFSVGGSVDRGGFFVIAREPGANWKELDSVAFWASSISRAITLCGFYLREVNPGFPGGIRPIAPTDDW